MKVVVTRPATQAAPLADRLRELGCDVVVCPLVKVEHLGDEPIDLAPYDWVIVTSVNGADELSRRRLGCPRRLAAIGPGTAAECERLGLQVDFVPTVSTQEGLVDELPRPHGRVLFAGAEDARPHLAQALGADVVPLYRTVALVPNEPPDGDLVVLASASAARAFAALGVAIPAVSIGPTTTTAARESGVAVVAEARTHDLDGLVSAVAEAGNLDPC
jgi:uroporphyrinogen-III synthase